MRVSNGNVRSGATGCYRIRSANTKACPAAVVALIVLFATTAGSNWPLAQDSPGPPNGDDLRERVERAALAVYIHGMTAEIARAEVGPEGVPVLLDLLADPAFPRRDNVVAFLAFLGGGETTRSLGRYMESPPAALNVPEEERALLLAPQALGQIAARGEPTALQLLLEITDPATGNGLLRQAAAHDPEPDRMHADLLRMALRGLAYSGAAAAESRLLGIARGELDPPGVADAREDARRALDLRQELRTSAATGEPMTGDGGEESTLTGGTLDTAARVHDADLTYANHVDLSDPMDDGRLDRVLEVASLRAGRGDDAADVACCITVSRSGTAVSFGSAGDGLDAIDDSSERNTVLDDRSARVKVVRAINYCAGPGTNIIGCAWRPGFGMAVVRMSGEAYEAILWIHEYGHNTGLTHNTTSTRYLMYGTNYGTNDLLNQQECDTFHQPDTMSEMSPTDTGACTDGDGDLVHDGIDNCPGTSNPDQQDSNGDGEGDACAESSCGNGSMEGGEECDGADLGGETCASLGYREGTLACDGQCRLDASGCACMDIDGDLWGDDAAPLGACAIDCDDADGMVWDSPGEAKDLIFPLDRDTLEWTTPTDPGGETSALAYDVLRSTNPSDFGSGASCIESDDATDTRADDPEVPAPGSVFFYLVRAQNACPDGWGSLGPGRTGRSCGS